MNQLLRKTSFASGFLLLFAPVVFSSVFNSVSGFRDLLYTLYAFSSDQMALYGIFLIVNTLEIVFFIKIFKAYRLREPHAYYLVYFLGILATLGMLGSSLLGTHQYLQIIKIIFFFVLLFALFSFRYQKENFVTVDNLSKVRNDVLTFVVLAAVVGTASFYTSIIFLFARFGFPYFLPALLSLIFVSWWRKRVNTGTLHSFIFLPGFYIIVTHLVLQLTVFYSFFQVISFLVGRSL
ncbi:MAG: hypothetical protein Q8P55_01830 [bacterium]|nr:hypothetical protein [bacterium]